MTGLAILLLAICVFSTNVSLIFLRRDVDRLQRIEAWRIKQEEAAEDGKRTD